MSDRMTAKKRPVVFPDLLFIPIYLFLWVRSLHRWRPRNGLGLCISFRWQVWYFCFEGSKGIKAYWKVLRAHFFENVRCKKCEIYIFTLLFNLLWSVAFDMVSAIRAQYTRYPLCTCHKAATGFLYNNVGTTLGRLEYDAYSVYLHRKRIAYHT